MEGVEPVMKALLATAAILVVLSGCDTAAEEPALIGGVIEVRFAVASEAAYENARQACHLQSAPTPASFDTLVRWSHDPGGPARDRVIACLRRQAYVLRVVLPV